MTVTLRDGSTVEDQRLDRLPSVVTEHLEKYPLTLATMPSQRSSMVSGTNWYSNFDEPINVKIDGRNRWVIGSGDLGVLRGGHATCLRNWEITDTYQWWDYYNQGFEGRCVEFATLRMLTHNNRRRYDITSRWHYFEMQKTDEWEGGSYPGASPQYDGTSVRAGLEIVRSFGAIPARAKGAVISAQEAPRLVKPAEGIAAYRWATNWDDVRAVLGVPDHVPGVPLNNSWGRNYPKEVLMLDEAGERLLREDGEFGVVTDR